MPPLTDKLLLYTISEAACIHETMPNPVWVYCTAIAIGIFDINSGQSFASVTGPLVQVPALILLVITAFWFKRKWYSKEGAPAPNESLDYEGLR